MMKSYILVITMLIFTLSSFAFNTGNNEVRTSYASFYHDKFNGRKTANGEIFNNNKITAAHKTLPFGSKVKVTNLRNKKSIIVRINDRGPYHSLRAIDLSKAAFKSIGNLKYGTMPIEYVVIK